MRCIVEDAEDCVRVVGDITCDHFAAMADDADSTAVVAFVKNGRTGEDKRQQSIAIGKARADDERTLLQ